MKNNKENSISGSENAENNLRDQTLLTPKFDWLSGGQFAFSLVAGLLLIGIALLSSLALALNGSISQIAFPDSQIISSYLFSAGLAFAGMLMIPSAVYAGMRLFGKRDPIILRWKKLSWISVIFPIPIILGYLLQTGPSWSHNLLPFIHVLANGAGIFFIMDMVRRKLPDGSAQRFWGAFGSGLTLAPAIIFVIEIGLLIVIGLVGLIFLQTQPDLKQDLLNLVARIQQSPGNQIIMERELGRIIARPGVTVTVLLYIAVLVPLVEELLKPIAVWFLLGRRLNPREGFVIGATAGAGYALFENLTIGADLDLWIVVVVSRLGTALIHVFASGLVGWGVASAWTEKRYVRLLGSYIAAVSLHGAWNGFNILSVLADFPSIQEQLSPFGNQFASFAPIGLVLLALGCLIGLLRTNLYYRRAIIAQD